MKKLLYPVTKEDFEALVIGEQVKIDHFAFQDRVFELCSVDEPHGRLSRDCVASASDNGTELRIVRDTLLIRG